MDDSTAQGVSLSRRKRGRWDSPSHQGMGMWVDCPPKPPCRLSSCHLVMHALVPRVSLPPGSPLPTPLGNSRGRLPLNMASCIFDRASGSLRQIMPNTSDKTSRIRHKKPKEDGRGECPWPSNVGCWGRVPPVAGTRGLSNLEGLSHLAQLAHIPALHPRSQACISVLHSHLACLV